MAIFTSTQWNVHNNTYLYIKSAPSEEEWKGCWYRDLVGNVLVGGDFSRQYGKEEAKKFARTVFERGDEKGRDVSQIEKGLLDAYNIGFNGFRTIHRSDVICLTMSQFQDYQDKMRHGDRLNLGERENSWLSEEPMYAEK